MNDPAAPDVQPPYLDRCSKMDFGQLRQFIDESLRQLSDPDPDADRPHSKEEFLELWEMLSAKSGISKGSPASLSYKPSETLASLRARRERTLEFLSKAPGDPSSTKKDIYKAERSLSAQERDIAQLEAREMRTHADRRDALNRTPHFNDTRSRVLERIRRGIERALSPKPTGVVQWEPLQPGEAKRSDVLRHYERLHHKGRIGRFDQERLDKATDLPYVEWLVPKSGLQAYSIFTFAHTEKVLLECPIYGNAVYIVDSREDRWLTMSKQELIESGEAKKIPHQGENWHEKVKQELGIITFTEHPNG